MKHINKFNNIQEYQEAVDNLSIDSPSISLIGDTREIQFTPDYKIEYRNILIGAINTYNQYNLGTGVFQIPASIGEELELAITEAQEAFNDNTISTQEFITKINNLDSADGTFISNCLDAELNAPENGSRYYLKIATPGHPLEGNAVMVSLGNAGGNNPTGYNFSATLEPAEYLAQAMIFTKVSDKKNTYNISIERPEGIVYLTYGTLNESAAAWRDSQIQGTTDSSKKGEFEIVYSSTPGAFRIRNIITQSYIDCQPGGSIYTDENISYEDFSVEEATQAEVTVSCKANKFSTVIFPFTPDINTGFDNISFNTSERINPDTGRPVLITVSQPVANVPYLVENKGSEDFSKTVSGWGTSTNDTYSNGIIIGVYTSSSIPTCTDDTDVFILQTQDGVQSLYRVRDEGFIATPYKCYFKVVDYSKRYFTTVAKTGGTIGFNGNNNISLSYSVNYGDWSESSTNPVVNVNPGDKIRWKGGEYGGSSIGTFTGGTASFDVEGNIMSLLYVDIFTESNSLEGKSSVFSGLFYSNSYLVSAKNLVLPATTLANYCYQNMFQGCTSLVEAPELPATTLATSCYYGMFEGCTSLVEAPELPATTLTEGCYNSMFRGCTSLVEAPELPATTLANYCYSYMFYDCRSLNYIKCLATDISANSCTYNWVSNVAALGTFTKASSMTDWSTGTSGIPNGWTVRDFD